MDLRLYLLRSIRWQDRGVSLEINALSTLLFLFTMLLVLVIILLHQRNKRSSRMGVAKKMKKLIRVYFHDHYPCYLACFGSTG